MPHSLPILNELPSGYFVEESPRGVLALHVDVSRAFHEVGFGPEHDGRLMPSELAGRQPLDQIEADGERFAIRRFHHGGLLRWITGDRFLDPSRPFRELIVSDALRKSGVRTPQVVGARARMARGVGWSLDLITRRVEGAIDLSAWLEDVRAGRVPCAERFAVVREAGVLVRDLHRVGLNHADLQPKNLLFVRQESGAPELWVLDLDGSLFADELRRSERRRNLRRLFRGVRRCESRGRPFLARSEFARFLLGYRPEGGSWKEDWRAIESAHGRAGIAHALGWWLERHFAGRPPSRDPATP